MSRRNHKELRTAVLLAVATLAGACSDPVTTPTPAPSATPARSAATAGGAWAATLDTITRGVALGLQDPALRRALKDEFRASRVTEHKLELQPFLATPVGGRLLTASASAVGLTPATFAAMTARVPTLDFYVPRRQDRRTWNGAGQVVVLGTAADGDDVSAISGYRTTGAAITFTARDLGRGPVVLLLHPAESKGIRADAQPDVPGAVIQDANDGQLSVRVVQTLPNGDSVVTPLTTLRGSGIAVRYGDRSGAESAALAPGDVMPQSTTGRTGLWVHEAYIIGVCDTWSCPLNGNEFEWKAFPQCGVCRGATTIGVDGVDADDFITISRQIDRFPPSNYSQGIRIEVYEMDYGADDLFGRQVLTGTNAPINFANPSAGTFTRFFELGANRCGYNPRPSECGVNGTYPQWKETNTSFIVYPG
jgi:hypothetical protein